MLRRGCREPPAQPSKLPWEPESNHPDPEGDREPGQGGQTWLRNNIASVNQRAALQWQNHWLEGGWPGAVTHAEALSGAPLCREGCSDPIVQGQWARKKEAAVGGVLYVSLVRLHPFCTLCDWILSGVEGWQIGPTQQEQSGRVPTQGSNSRRAAAGTLLFRRLPKAPKSFKL